MGTTIGDDHQNPHQRVNLSAKRPFGKALKSDLKETFFPDNPFRGLDDLPAGARAFRVLKYFVPILEWGPKYALSDLRYDLLAGVTIASLAIPQGISYARLANLPPIIGLYSSFVPPLIYAVFGSSKNLAVGTVAAASLLLASVVGADVSAAEDPQLYLNTFYSAAFFTGVMQAALGIFRLGILVDFLSRSTITGFMGGTAIIIILQQLKGLLGMQHFTTKTDLVSVMHSVFYYRHEWRWESFVLGICFLFFLLLSRHLVGDLKKGLNPISISDLNFQSRHLSTAIKAGLLSGFLALAEGIAVGRSLALMKNEQIDGNKEMIAFGIMNIVGSFTSCYLTTGPFSKSAVNFHAGCKTAMSNVVMSICIMMVLLFLAPLFKYTPLVALAAIIVVAMIGLIEIKEFRRLFKVDKFDFCICMVAFLGVVLFSMVIGLSFSVGLSIIRALLYVARPTTCRLGNIRGTALFRDTKQYPDALSLRNVLILKLGSPIFFANAGYLRERITRWLEDEKSISKKNGEDIHHVIVEFGCVTSIDNSGIGMLNEVHANLDRRGIQMALVNPRLEVTDKLMSSGFIERVGQDWVFLSVNDAVTACRFNLQESRNKEDQV